MSAPDRFFNLTLRTQVGTIMMLQQRQQIIILAQVARIEHQQPCEHNQNEPSGHAHQIIALDLTEVNPN